MYFARNVGKTVLNCEVPSFEPMHLGCGQILKIGFIAFTVKSLRIQPPSSLQSSGFVGH
jgi:hypothetical protein